MCTVWFVEIHLQIIRLRYQYAWCYYYCCCFPSMTKVFFEKRLEFTDQKLTNENAINSCLCIFIDILAPIHLVNFIVTDGQWNVRSQNIPGVQVYTQKLESEWAFACVCVCMYVFVLWNLLGIYLNINYSIQITINFDCLTDSIKRYLLSVESIRKWIYCQTVHSPLYLQFIGWRWREILMLEYSNIIYSYNYNKDSSSKNP